MKKRYRALLLIIAIAGLLPFSSQALWGVYLQNPVEVDLEADDAIGVKLQTLKMADQDIPLERASIFKPRKKLSFSFYPGNYFITWTTLRDGTKGTTPVQAEHARLIVIERGDALVRIRIAGNEISVY